MNEALAKKFGIQPHLSITRMLSSMKKQAELFLKSPEQLVEDFDQDVATMMGLVLWQRSLCSGDL